MAPWAVAKGQIVSVLSAMQNNAMIQAVRL